MAAVSGFLAARHAVSQGVDGKLAARYASALGLAGELSARYASRQGLSGDLPARHSTGQDGLTKAVVSGYLAARYATPQKVSGEIAVRYEVRPQDVAAGVSAYDVAWKGLGGYTEPELDVTLTVWVDDDPNSPYDLTGIPNNVQITHNESATNSWQLTITDDIGEYHPKKAGGDWEGVMNSRAFNENDEITKKFLVRAVYAGHEYLFVGVPNRMSHSRDASSGQVIEMTWGGVGLSARLSRRDQTLATLRSTRTAVLTNKAMLTDLLGNYGIAFSLARLDTENCRTQHRNGIKAQDAMQALVDVTLGEWQEEGETLVFYQPNYTSPAKWKYNSSTIIYEQQLDDNAEEVVNQVTCKRAVEQGKSNQASPTALNTFGGGQTVSFLVPLSNLSWKATGAGIVSDVLCKDKAGNVTSVLNPRNGTYAQFLIGAPTVNIYSVEFTWGAPTNVNASGSPGSVQFYGSQIDAASVQGEEWDPVNAITMPSDEYPHASATASQGEFGVWPIELTPNPLMWDTAAMARFCTKFLNRKAWDTEPVSCRVELNLAMRPGDNVEIDDDVLGIVEKRYIKQVTHSLSPDPAQRFTRFTAIFCGQH